MHARLAPLACLVLTLTACWPEPSAPAPVSVAPTPAAWTGATWSDEPSATLVLDRMPATWMLAPTNAPEGTDVPETFLVHDFKVQRRGGRAYATFPIPFRLPASMRRFRPTGTRLWADDVPAVFTAVGEGSKRQPIWRLIDDTIWVHAPDETIREVRIFHPAGDQEARRLDWRTAQADGLDADAYVHHGITLGTESREGLLLPAPSAARWDNVTLPKGARLSATVALASSPIATRSDGATLVLALQSPEGERVLATHEIPEGATRFQRWEADLSVFGGARGTLVLRTEPGASSFGDYVFVGSPAIHGTGTRTPRRVIVVGIDTLRPDRLGVNGSTLGASNALDTWARDAVVFDRAWAPAPRTRPSFRTSTTGRNPLQAVCAKNIGEVFDEAGFATAGIVANVHLSPRFGFHEGFDYWQLEGSAKAPEQLGLARSWLEDHATRDSYLFLHLMDPHLFYVAPPAWEDKFTGPLDQDLRPPLPRTFNREIIYRMDHRNELSPLHKEHIRARYAGEVAYTSDLLAEFLTWVDTLPGESTVVIHSDHGEELWDHGGFEHNHTLYDEVVRAVLMVKPPGGSGMVDAHSPFLSTLADIGPTLYELAGLTDVPPSDGQSLVPALRGEAGDPERALPVAYLKWSADRWGVVWRDHKYILVTGTGKEELYDLRTDPGEQHDLSETTDTTPYWQAMGEAHPVDVGHGWRIQLAMLPDREATLTLPADALSANVLDPEAITHHPANLAWGERPKQTPEDVGVVTLEAPRTLHIVAGPDGRGTAYVRFADDTAVQGTTLRVGDHTAPLIAHIPSEHEGVRIVVEPGIVVVPPETETERMVSCESTVSDEDEHDKIEELCRLGYIDMDAPECEPYRD